MTKAQQNRIKMLKEGFMTYDFYHSDKYEFKEFSVTENEQGDVVVYAVSGRKNDEGTMAECLCRKYRHIYIGKNGGLTSYTNSKKNNKGAALHKFSDVVIYGYSD